VSAREKGKGGGLPEGTGFELLANELMSRGEKKKEEKENQRRRNDIEKIA